MEYSPKINEQSRGNYQSNADLPVFCIALRWTSFEDITPFTNRQWKGFLFLKKVLVKNTDLKKSYFEWEDKLKENVTVKSFTDSIHSAISGNLELAELFNSLFKKAEGERKCQLKK